MRRSVAGCIAVVVMAAAAQAGMLDRVAPTVFSPGAASQSVNRVRFVFSSADDTRAMVRVYDITGALVRRTLDRESDTVLFWDGTDNGGARVRSGVYIYEIQTDSRVTNGAVVVAQ